ncbi:MAG: DUF4153 domain-containing protein [Firmicutes bacterium]|nr:DUF4153 domain-containing protein [Bacillota bacterium]
MNARLRDLFERGRRAAVRFWPALVFALAAAFFQCYFIFGDGYVTIFGKPPLLLSAVSVIAFFAALAAKLYTENLEDVKRGDVRHLLVALAVVLIILLTYFRLDDVTGDELIYLSDAFITIFIASGLTTLFAGAFHREREFLYHVIGMLLDVVIAYIYAFVLSLAVALVLLGVDVLFGVVNFDRAILYVETICLMPVMALFFLARIPEAGENYQNERGVLLVVDNLFNNILVPVMTIYVLLLYVYLVKIIFSLELPTTSIVNLVLWPLMLIVFVLFAVDRDRERSLTYYFRRYMPFAAFPLLGLMYYAWFLRVGQYGITENRYMVFALGIWLTFAMVHFIIEKRDLHVILPMTLSIVLFVSAFGGPIGAKGMSYRSQQARLEALLIKNRMLKGDKIVPSKHLPDEDKRQILETANYLVAHHDVSQIPYLKEGDPDEIASDLLDERKKDIADADDLSVDLGANGIDVSGYDRLYEVESYGDEKREMGEMTLERNDGVVTLSFSDGRDIVVDLRDILAKVAVLSKSKALDLEDLAIEGKSGEVDYKIYVTKTQFSSGAGEIKSGDGVSMYILLKDVDPDNEK